MDSPSGIDRARARSWSRGRGLVLAVAAAALVVSLAHAAEKAPPREDPRKKHEWSDPLDGVKRDRQWIASQLRQSLVYLGESKQALQGGQDPAALERAFDRAYRAYRLTRYAAHGVEAIMIRGGEGAQRRAKASAVAAKPVAAGGLAAKDDPQLKQLLHNLQRAMDFNRQAHKPMATMLRGGDREPALEAEPAETRPRRPQAAEPRPAPPARYHAPPRKSGQSGLTVQSGPSRSGPNLGAARQGGPPPRQQQAARPSGPGPAAHVRRSGEERAAQSLETMSAKLDESIRLVQETLGML
jgi:hypothetical protein